MESNHYQESKKSEISPKKVQKKYQLPRLLKQIVTNGTESEEVGDE